MRLQVQTIAACLISAGVAVAFLCVTTIRASAFGQIAPRMQTGEATTRSLRQKTQTCSSYDGERVYVNVDGSRSQSVYVFAADARNATNPLCLFTSSALTQVFGGMVVDTGGKLWIVDTINGVIDVFPHGSNGTVDPAQVISGAKTLMVGFGATGSQHPAMDAAGDCWVPQWWGYNGFTGYVTAYGNSGNGNVAPVATIGYGDKGASEGIAAPVAVAFDSQGNLYVVDYGLPSSVVVFSSPFSDTEKPAAKWTLQDLARFISVDAADNVYLASESTVYTFKGGLQSGGRYKSYSLVTRQQGGSVYDFETDPAGRQFLAPIFPLYPNKKHGSQLAVGVLQPSAHNINKATVIYPKGTPFYSEAGTLAAGT